MRRTWGAWSRGIHPHGFLCGVLMSVCAYLLRNWDVPVPLVTVIAFTPAFILSGFLVARRHGGDQGMAAGVAATVTGYVVVFLTTVAYKAVNESIPNGLIWILVGITFLPAALLFGALWGSAGAALARSLRHLSGH